LSRQKKIMSRSFLNSGTLIVILSLILYALQRAGIFKESTGAIGTEEE
jgi:hypothetical protein